jgi:hypothetical protein
MAKSDDDNLTPEDMRVWLHDEVMRLLKEADLRIKDATDFVVEYGVGNLTAAEAMHRMTQYQRRWGESNLIAVMSDEKMSNEEILRRLDSERSAILQEHWTKKEKGSESKGRSGF